MPTLFRRRRPAAVAEQAAGYGPIDTESPTLGADEHDDEHDRRGRAAPPVAPRSIATSDEFVVFDADTDGEGVLDFADFSAVVAAVPGSPARTPSPGAAPTTPLRRISATADPPISPIVSPMPRTPTAMASPQPRTPTRQSRAALAAARALGTELERMASPGADAQCAICLCALRGPADGDDESDGDPSGDEIFVTSCRHAFHKSCLAKARSFKGTGKTCPLCRASIKTGLTPVHKARPGEENRRPAPPARPFPPEALASRGNGYQNRAGRVAAFAVLDHARAREVAAAAADSIRAPAAGSGSNSEPTEHAPSVVSAAQRTRNAMRRALSVQSLRFRSAGASRG